MKTEKTLTFPRLRVAGTDQPLTIKTSGSSSLSASEIKEIQKKATASGRRFRKAFEDPLSNTNKP